MMKIIVTVFASIYLLSCSDCPTDITGKYKSGNPNLVWQYISNKQYSTGSELAINEDNSFIYKNCAQITKGSWKVKKDSLYLYCNEIRFIIDSINTNPKYRKGTECGTAPDVYKINGDYLITRLHLKNGRTGYTQMKKIN